MYTDRYSIEDLQDTVNESGSGCNIMRLKNNVDKSKVLVGRKDQKTHIENMRVRCQE